MKSSCLALTSSCSLWHSHFLELAINELRTVDKWFSLISWNYRHLNLYFWITIEWTLTTLDN
jgi:hypothetical protein